MTTERIRVVAIAILYRENQFLLQLRDEVPGIVYPGHWGLFGGHLEGEELPEVGLRRELLEEIGYAPTQLSEFGCYPEPHVVRHVYHGYLEVGLEDLVLGEGWDMALLSPDDIRRGEHYSEKAGQVKPLGQAHQKILLDFIAQ